MAELDCGLKSGSTASGKRPPLPDFLTSLSSKCLSNGHKLLYPSLNTLTWALAALCVALAMGIPAAKNPWKAWVEPYVSTELAFAAAFCFLLFLRRENSARPVYLLDLACFRPPDILRAPHSTFLEHSKVSGIFNEQSLAFQRKILERCGLGQCTSFPMCFRQLPPKPSMAAAREEAETVLCTCMKELLEKTGIAPKDIGIVVVNCSTFNPTPSLSSMIVNKFKLRSNVRTYNLGGMGCSAGVIAIDLAKDALQVHQDTYAVVLSTENITQNWYWGNNRTMLVSNCLFRVGGAAMMLSNKARDKKHAKYRLEHVVRTHRGADDAAYHAAYQEEDADGQVGIFLSKDLMRIAAETLRINMQALGPRVLPYSEQLLFLANYLMRTVFKADVAPYVPDFKKAFDHFCIHSGGRAVIAAVEKGLSLTPLNVEPSKMTLHRFGNTSVSTTWYQFQYLECKGRMKKGDKIWQIAFGSGFKCNSAVWTALRTVRAFESKNAWTDTILNYPVTVAECQEF